MNTSANPIIDKLRKLQALADRAGTEAEATAAMLRVQELLRRHNLDIGVLQLQEDEGLQSEVGPAKSRAHGAHVEILALACDGVFNVRHFVRVTMAGHRYCFLGLNANVEAAGLTFSWLIASVESLLDGFKRQPEDGFLFAQWTRRDYDAFRLGAAVRIRQMAEEKAAESSAAFGELVHIGNALANRMHDSLKLKTRPMNARGDVRDSAFRHGYRQGSRVDFHGARKSRMLSE